MTEKHPVLIIFIAVSKLIYLETLAQFLIKKACQKNDTTDIRKVTIRLHS